MPPPIRAKYPHQFLTRIAALSQCDRRTVIRYLEGQRVVRQIHNAISETLRAEGREDLVRESPAAPVPAVEASA